MIELIKIKRKYINYILGKLSKGDILDELELSLNKEPANIELFFLYVAILEVSEDSIEYNKLKMHGTEDMLEYINFLSFSEEEKRSYLEDLFEKGNRSAFLYAHTYELYEKDTNLSENLKISFLRWANTHKIKLTKINDYSLKRDLNLFRNVYAKNKNTEILKNLCIAQMEAKDYSLAAYFHYKKLYEKQIYTREFNEALIKAAYTNKRDDISLFPIKKYLENWQAEKDEDILAFIIDLAIQKEPRLIDKYNLKAKIIELVLKSYNNGNNLKKEEAGSGQNLKLSISIEAFCLLNFKGDLTKDIVTNIEKNILDELFLYEVFPRNKKVKQIYVSSNEKKEAKHYTLSEEFNNGNKLNENSLLNMPYVSNINGFKVTALEDFQIMGLDDSGIFIYSKYKIKERVPGKKDLYKYFYMKGVTNTNLLISLSKTLTMEDPILKDILIKLLSRGISESFRSDINAKLGFLTKDIIYYKNHLEAVLKYQSELNEKYSEEMFLICIKNREYELAKTIKNIPEETQVKGFETMLLDNIRIDKDIIYSLVLKGYKSEVFINYLLQTHKVSIEDWLALKDPRLNERIIEQAYKQRSLEGQKIFPEYYYNTLKSRLLEEYTNFLLEQVIAKNIVLEDEVVKALEHMYISNDEPTLLVGIGLSHLQRNNYSKILEKCINYVQEEGIYLEQFKDLSPTHLIQHNRKDTACFPELGIKLPLKNSFFGIYTTTIPIFHGEKLKYYFESNPNEILTICENGLAISKEEYEFFYINNALIYLSLLRFDELERELEKLVKKKTKHFLTIL